jgi:hypothetical protein
MSRFISSTWYYSRLSVNDEALSNKTYSRRVSLAQTQTKAYLLRAADLHT